MVNWRRQHRVFITLLVGLFILSGLLALRYDKQWDLTESKRNQLTVKSLELLKQLEAPVQITAFVRGNPKVKRLIQRLISQYQQQADIHLSYSNPDLSPEQVRRYHLVREGEMLIRYQDKTAVSRQVNESGVSGAISQLLRDRPPRVVFLTGHGERGFDETPTGYALLLKQLAAQGIRVSLLDLRHKPQIPPETDLVVLSDPQTVYSQMEQQAIIDYLPNGRLLWLTDPASAQLPYLTQVLGVRGEVGILRNRSAEAYGLAGKSLLAIEPKSALPLLDTIDSLLVFSSLGYLQALPTQAQQDWVNTPLLTVTEKTIIQKGQDLTMAHLPLTVALKLTAKKITDKRQIVIVADADFLSNQLIKLGQNLSFAMNLFTQLAQPDNEKPLFFEQSSPSPVVLSEKQLAQQALFYLLVMPLLIVLLGYWLRRKLCNG